MPALRYSEDTEFNDALRQRGILPALPAEPSSPEPMPCQELSPQQQIGDLQHQKAIEEFELDHQVPASVIDSWKSARQAELRSAQQIVNAHSAGVKPIGKEDYLREVNQASEVDVDPSLSHASKGTGVVICLWNNSAASKHLLSLLEKLSQRYPSTRFLSIPGGSCIANYPDVNQPTLICYRAGACLRQYVGIGSSLEVAKTNGRLSAGLALGLPDLEAELLAIGALDELLRTKSAALPPADASDDEDEGGRSHIRPLAFSAKRNIRPASRNGSDSELDI